MTIEATGTEERIESRTRRAAEESMTVVPAGCGEFEVYSGETAQYTVNLPAGECSCPDYEHHEPADGCKHIRRVEMEAGIRDIPKLPGRSDVELMMGPQVAFEASEPADKPLMADGGQEDECPHPDCEYGQDKERPVLCYSHWREWS